jgi:histidinol-phosphatase (PHP family)
MMKMQNLHIHTNYADGKDKPEDIILMAIEKGFNSIGFSEHTYMEYSDYPNQMTIDKMYDYRDEITDLKEKYADRLSIFCGLEYDLYSEVSTKDFDYVIGSVHYLDFGGKKAGFDRSVEEVRSFLDRYFNGDGLKFAEKYFETLIQLPQKCNVDILGHFDILLKPTRC